MRFAFTANDESDTDRFGAALADVLPAGSVVALVGTLGAGKTRLVQAIAKAVGIDPKEVVSPTFVLVHEYQAGPPRKGGVSAPQNPGLPAGAEQAYSRAPVTSIYHLDAYRIRDDDEFRELGPEEYFESDGWTFVEWADRVIDCLPRDYLRIELEVMGPNLRRFTMAPIGDRFQKSLDSLRAKLAE